MDAVVWCRATNLPPYHRDPIVFGHCGRDGCARCEAAR